MTDSLVSFLSFIGASIIAFWCVIGFAMHTRWGYQGVLWVWRHRAAIDRAVVKDMRKIFSVATGAKG